MSIVLDGTSGVVVSGNTNTLSGITVGKGAGAVSTNTAVGASALAANTTGSRSVAVGDFALAANTTGYRNVALGSEALTSNTTGYYNTGLGWRALNVNTTGNENTASGYYSLLSNTTGSFNTAYGGGALQSNTTSSNNTAVGYQASYANTTGARNTSLGNAALYGNTTTTYSDATAIGYTALYQGGGGKSTAIGANALYAENGSGGANVGIGYNALTANTSGGQNTAVGYQAGYLITTGSKNTIVGGFSGNQGGLDIRTASNYIVLSDGDGNPRGIFETANFLVGSTTNALTGGIMIIPNNGNSLVRVGHVAGTGSTSYYSQFYYDSNLIGSIQQLGTTAVTYLTSSDYRLKEDVQPMQNALAKVAALKPCTYKWKSDGSDGEGFIAHELAEVVPMCVSGEKDEVDEDGNPKYQGVDTSFLVATLTAAIQELKAEFDAYKATHP